MKIKILAAICVAVAVGVLVGVIGLNALGTASDSAQTPYRGNVSSVAGVGQLDASFAEMRLAIALHANSPAAAKGKHLHAYEAAKVAFDAALTTYRGSTPSGTPDQIAEILGVSDGLCN